MKLNLRNANSRDRKYAARNRDRKTWYKVGGVPCAFAPTGFLVCKNCESKQVYKAYDPAFLRFTYYCFDCSAKDDACWSRQKGIAPPPERPPSRPYSVPPTALLAQSRVPCVPTEPVKGVRVFAPGTHIEIRPVDDVMGYEPPPAPEPEPVPAAPPDFATRTQAYWLRRAEVERAQRLAAIQTETERIVLSNKVNALRKAWGR